jgi:cytochrome c2
MWGAFMSLLFKISTALFTLNLAWRGMQRLIALLATSAALLATTAISSNEAARAAQADSSPPSAERGKKLIAEIGCGLCHRIPGIDQATGNVGPPLDGIGSRAFIAGVLNNTTDNMVHWLRFPQKVVPGNAMPDMALDESQARDIAAYLETIK